MALTTQDMKHIDDRAELMAERVVEKVVAKVLATHQATCPHGRWLNDTKRLAIGVGVGIVLMSAGSSAAVSLVIKFL